MLNRLVWLPLLTFLMLIALLALWSGNACADKTESGIVVIMAPGSAPVKLAREQLALIFKAKKNFWEDGTRVQPVNLPVSHPVRRAFSMQIFKQNPEEMDDYWSDMYFHGVLPPFVLSSEEAVIRFVAATPGAIAYVSHCAADRRVVVILQIDSSVSCQKANQ